jgi:hypothetical protein
MKDGIVYITANDLEGLLLYIVVSARTFTVVSVISQY